MTDTSHQGAASPSPDDLASYLERTRWFGGKGRPLRVSDVRTLGEVPGRLDDSPWVVVHVVEVSYDDGQQPDTELYQVPLALYTDPQGRLDHAFVGWWEDPERGWVHAYDALHDREAMACWQRAFSVSTAGEAADRSGLAFHTVGEHEIDLEAHSTLFSGEQSNSSVAFGDDAVLKVFRKITPGLNPDIQIHEALTRAGSEHVAPLYGWVDVVDEPTDSVVQLAMLQKFLRTATDGWDLALGSVRTLFAEPETAAAESGGDFAGEAARLGAALREVHEQLLVLGTDTVAAPEVAAAMVRRLREAANVVPGLAAHVQRLTAAFDRVADLGELPVQRVHGDLHLGQTLRTALGWKIVDFEGEPAKPLAERLLPDSVWRDVAGMLRSFDYAPHAVTRQGRDVHGGEDAVEEAQLVIRSREWSSRAREAFLSAYADGPLTADQKVLLDAYVADKAVYETVYETRNRPTWVEIPLEAVARIGAV
ncbi:hypothetical protein [Nocardioides sp. SYSU D00038]|uniref:maltokinase N-terminal cap-like domain-containing protein n=1 Tax=Nocardioides sp. SYSU D00038 TaxID=2812554 RepID=UPI0027DC1E3C|nr:hypothetical protein [Nocardioides sp. SYSU D00038]